MSGATIVEKIFGFYVQSTYIDTQHDQHAFVIGFLLHLHAYSVTLCIHQHIVCSTINAASSSSTMSAVTVRSKTRQRNTRKSVLSVQPGFYLSFPVVFWSYLLSILFTQSKTNTRDKHESNDETQRRSHPHLFRFSMCLYVHMYITNDVDQNDIFSSGDGLACIQSPRRSTIL